MVLNNSRRLEKAVLKTLSYHNLFHYPLKQKEIKRLLIKYSLAGDDLSKILAGLIKKGKVDKEDDLFFLKGRQAIVMIRKKRLKPSLKKEKIAQEMVNIIKAVPFVKGIALTGGLAMLNSNKNDDIDLFIITKKNTLWLTRLLLLAILTVLKKRPRIGKNKKNLKDKICANLFLEEDALKIRKQQQNLFIAHEIAQMKVLVNRGDILQTFLQENIWVKSYLPNFLNNQTSKKETVAKRNSNFLKKQDDNVVVGLVKILNQFAFSWQEKILQKKKKQIKQVTLKTAFLVNKNQGQMILQKYGKALKKI